MPTYTRSDLKSRINAGIKGKIGVLIDADETVNQVVRAVVSDIDTRSTRRMVSSQPGVFDEQLAYPAPVDLKARKLLSLSNQAEGNDVYVGYNLIPYEQFNQKLGFVSNRRDGNYTQVRFGNERELYTVSFDDRDSVRRMLISAPKNNTELVLSTLDSLTDGGGLWTSFGDAENVDADPGNRVEGVASIKYDIDAAGGLTAGIYNATMNEFDISGFLESNNSVFGFANISDAEDITNFTLRLGNDGSNYYEMAVTLTHFRTAFALGWNTLRFDVGSRVEVGTVDPATMSYIALFMTKATGKISQQNFNFDNLVMASGNVMNMRYYSKYGWQTQAGAWIENSTRDDDFLNAEGDEFDFIIEKGISMAGREVDENDAAKVAETLYREKTKTYLLENPSEALVETNDYQAQYYI